MDMPEVKDDMTIHLHRVLLFVDEYEDNYGYRSVHIHICEGEDSLQMNHYLFFRILHSYLNICQFKGVL